MNLFRCANETNDADALPAWCLGLCRTVGFGENAGGPGILAEGVVVVGLRLICCVIDSRSPPSHLVYAG